MGARKNRRNRASEKLRWLENERARNETIERNYDS